MKRYIVSAKIVVGVQYVIEAEDEIDAECVNEDVLVDVYMGNGSDKGMLGLSQPA